MAQVNAPRARRRVTPSPERDFAPAQPARGRTASLLRPLVVALTVSMLGLGVAASVVTARASTATEQNQSSLVVDADSPDQSQAAPAAVDLTAEQVAAARTTETSRTTDSGGLTSFDRRGTTVNRNSVRSSLDQTLAVGTSATRQSQLTSTSSLVTLTQAEAEQRQREARMQADVAKVMAEAARIEREKRKAEALLRSLGVNPGSGVNLGDLTELLNSARVSLPLAPGTYRVGAHFGQVGPWASYHTGQDFPAAYGTPIRAVAPGVIGSPVAAWWPGNNVVVHHANGGSTLYAHMSRSAVRPGQVVAAGQVIGYVGSTGNSYGNHLHFEYYPPGTTPGDVYSASNPMGFLRSLGL